MFERLFSPCYTLLARHRRLVLGLVLLLTLAAGAGLTLVRYEGNIDRMLPPDPEVTRSLAFLRDSNLSDKVIVSLALTDPARSKQELFQAVDRLAGALQPPLFTKAVTGVNVAGAMDEFSILRYAPQILGPADLEAIDRMLTPETVEAKLRAIYRQALRPESVMMSSLSRSDPLGVKLLFMDKLRALPSSMGFEVAVEDGHFLSRDGRHALLIVQTPVPMTDSRGSREMIEALRAQLAGLPAYVSADVICGHLHTLGNEEAIKRDIKAASLVAAAAYVLLLLLIFRDPRILFVLIIPAIAVVWSIVLAAAVQGALLYMVIGFGTAISGISIDFGLLVYIGLKQGGDERKFLCLARLVTIDALTTICGFAVLFFSLIRGYHQLALFSILCVLICLFFSIFVLPLLLARSLAPPPARPAHAWERRLLGIPDGWRVALWLLATAVVTVCAFSVRFDSDVKKLDGSGQAVEQAERRFHEVWGGNRNQALFVVTAPSVEAAMEVNDRVYRAVLARLPAGAFTSLAQFWPAEKTRRENAARWDRFWAEGRSDRLQALLAGASPAYGFAPQAFAPFFDGLATRRDTAPAAGEMIGQLRERFIVERGGEASILSFFPDDPRTVAVLKEVAAQHPGAFIVSGSALSAAISTFTAREMALLAPLALLANLVMAWLFFRDWRDTLIAHVPLLTGMLWLVGMMAVFGLPLNVVNIVAAIISTGVIVDYGLGMTYENRQELRLGTPMAVTLSAATNVIGAGALLVTTHPALFSTGVAMVICMVTGYLSAMFVVPPLCRLVGPPRAAAAEAP
ncbi:MAG: hypothetical protein FDZ69_09620 [Deltaproteobacteria bacterium]|nr:MAG: hypothetical protein FDZ69_09620 [Deltaproteobacteria bacterium]